MSPSNRCVSCGRDRESFIRERVRKYFNFSFFWYARLWLERVMSAIKLTIHFPKALHVCIIVSVSMLLLLLFFFHPEISNYFWKRLNEYRIESRWGCCWCWCAVNFLAQAREHGENVAFAIRLFQSAISAVCCWFWFGFNICVDTFG